MAAAISLRIAFAVILIPAVAASAEYDAFSKNLFGGITP